MPREMKVKTVTRILLVTLGVVACNRAAKNEPIVLPVARRVVAPPVAIADSTLGLSRTDVLEAPSPDAIIANTVEPGDGGLLDRANPEWPPPISHSVADMLPIERTDNACLDCHGDAEPGSMVEAGDPIPMPESHYVDLRHAPTDTRDSPAGARFVCMSCHVVQTGAEPLVVNDNDAR